MQKSSSKIKSKENISNPKRLLYLLLPIAALLIAGGILMKSDLLYVLEWFLVLLLFGLASLPITFTIFKNFGSGGYIMSKPIGILSIALVIWTLAYIDIIPFSRASIIVMLIILFGVSYGIKPLRDNFLSKINEPLVIERIAVEETLFAAVLVILCFFKGFLPIINGQEKFMDYGFIMSMLRSSELPAKDMWLSGYSINYYYFGQYIYAMLIKFCGIVPSVGYNIAMCTSIALPFMMAFVIGTQLVEAASQFNYLGNTKVFRYIVGSLAGLLTMIFGNSHSFFYDENCLGNQFLKFFQSLGINVGQTDGFFYPSSTRFIGHNPDLYSVDAAGNVINPGDYTIHEFPFYSYLVGDLHAHVVSMMIVLLIMAICIAIVSNASHPNNTDMVLGEGFINGFKNSNGKTTLISWLKSTIKSEKNLFLTFELISVGILLGCAMMCNYWDFLIYFIFCSMTLLVISIRRSSTLFGNPTGWIAFIVGVGGILGVYLLFADNVALHIILQLVVLAVVFLLNAIRPCALSRTAVGMSFIFTLANIVALPFNANFDMISNTLGKVKNHSSLYQLFILWGTAAIICLLFVIFTIVYKNHIKTNSILQSKGMKETPIFDEPSEGYTNIVSKFIGERNLIDVFVCGMIVVGFLLIIAPEIFYVRDIYTGGYLRSNTMFKFTFAAFIILGICVAYAVTRMFIIVRKDGVLSNKTFVAGIICCFLLIIPAHYTKVALEQRCGEISISNYDTLDGTAYLSTYASTNVGTYEEGNLAEYEACIDWFNESVSGQPVIAEAFGLSYTDYCIVSANTGLPTVCGWQTHEWLWRFHGILDEENDLLISDPEQDVWDLYLTPRHNDITTLYTTNDPAIVQQIAAEYGVEYIISGQLEYSAFGVDNSPVLEAAGEVVFTCNELVVVKVS